MLLLNVLWHPWFYLLPFQCFCICLIFETPVCTYFKNAHLHEFSNIVGNIFLCQQNAKFFRQFLWILGDCLQHNEILYWSVFRSFLIGVLVAFSEAFAYNSSFKNFSEFSSLYYKNKNSNCNF